MILFIIYLDLEMKVMVFLLFVGLVVGSYHPDIARKLGIAETATYASEQ